MVPVVAQQWLADPQAGPPGSPPRHRGAPPGLPRGTRAAADDEEDELDDAEWEAVDVFVRAGMVNTLDAAWSTARVAAGGAWSRVG
jgi:hypothetical protein